MMLVALLANPAPESIELGGLVLLSLPFFLAISTIPLTVHYQMSLVEQRMFIALLFYLSYLLVSFLMGLLQGVSLLGCLRSTGPYVNFFPLLMLGLLPRGLFNPTVLAIILICIGGLQASYHIFLYFSNPQVINNTMDVLRGRITLIDPRTTVPLILSAAVLPLGLLTLYEKKVTKNMMLKLLCAGLITLGLFGAAVTLTRAIILSLFFGWIIFILAYGYKKIRHAEALTISKKQLILFSVIGVFLMIAILEVPSVDLLVQGVVTRFSKAAQYSESGDYSNGRLYDEWMPALDTWNHSGVMGMLFGIGAGNEFTVITGEERTYIHNLAIYSLVYGGFFGFIACFYLYYIAFKTLILRALETKQMIYVGFAALLASLFFYAQLFAVHKGLAYNALLFLILSLALSKPLHSKPYGE